MENCSFQSQCMSIMEILAKAALAEINRRVDDSCAVLRLEISQSQNDIYVLKKKCEVMEAELKRTRIRAKKKGFQTSVSERCSPLVKNFINKEVDSVAWDRESSVELMQHPQRADMEPAGEVDVIPIKEETAEESTWNNDHVEQNTQAEHQPFIPDVLIEHYHSESSALLPSLTDDPDAFPSIPDQQVTDYQTHADLVVKREREEEAEKAAGAIGIGSGSCFVVDDAERQPWPPTDCDRDIGTGDPGFPYGTMPQYEQSPSLFTCQSGPATSHSMNEDIGSPMHSVGKLHLARLTAARVKRRARNFGYKRLQQMHAPEEGRSTLTPVNSIHQSGLSLQPAQQHQYRTTTAAAAVGTRDLSQGSTAPHHLATSAYSGYSRGNIGLARTRMRTPLWRTGIGEKRFSCTYCGKSFMRFSQLKEHLRSHTGEKPFSCLQCGRSFTKQCNLIRHAVVHSGEKPYECATCGKCFTQRSSLKSHQKTVH